jgi:hypothetical protein
MGRPTLHQEGDLCEECGINEKASQGYTLTGVRRFRAVCNTCHKTRYIRPWLAFRKDYCEMCPFVPMFQRSLVVHHRDGDKTNNEEYNLMTLCHNCHNELHGLLHESDGDSKLAEKLYRKFIKALLG